MPPKMFHVLGFLASSRVQHSAWTGTQGMLTVYKRKFYIQRQKYLYSCTNGTSGVMPLLFSFSDTNKHHNVFFYFLSYILICGDPKCFRNVKDE